MLITLGGLLGSSRRWLVALGAVFALAAAGSSFLILRQAPVAPTDARGRARPDPAAGRG